MANIESLFAREKWVEARRLIQQGLKREPKSHWLLTRLATTYYEERRYAKALDTSKRALRLAGDCPLVLWGYAGALAALGRNDKALRIYDQLLHRGVRDIATGNCGEGRAWARGLIADVHYQSALCYRKLGQTKKARSSIRKHLLARGPGSKSIYSVVDARRLAEDLGVKVRPAAPVRR
jgi:tetratricopeptide (TPR) repeat protein